MQAATAISASQASFAAGLLEAAIQVHADGDAVLLSAYDIAARGPLAEVAPSTQPFGIAFVLSPGAERPFACAVIDSNRAAAFLGDDGNAAVSRAACGQPDGRAGDAAAHRARPA